MMLKNGDDYINVEEIPVDEIDTLQKINDDLEDTLEMNFDVIVEGDFSG